MNTGQEWLFKRKWLFGGLVLLSGLSLVPLMSKREWLLAFVALTVFVAGCLIWIEYHWRKNVELSE